MALFTVALTLMLLTYFYLSKLGILPPKNVFRLYFYFFAGASLFLAAETITLDHVKASLIGFVLLAASIFTDKFYYFYVPLMIYLTMYFAYVPGGILRKFNLVGDYSYGIYIYAFPVQQSLIVLIPDISIFEMIIYASIITMSCAVLSWHLIEKKALSYK